MLSSILFIVAWCTSAALNVTLNFTAPVAVQPTTYLSQMFETIHVLNSTSKFVDSAFITASRPLAPAVLRVGGTSADFATYVFDYSQPVEPALSPGDVRPRRIQAALLAALICFARLCS